MVNRTANCVTIYEKDANGEYTVPVKAMVCSCGTATPKSGTYKTSDRYTWRALVGNVYGKYATRIVGSILFHSVPYTAIDNASLEEPGFIFNNEKCRLVRVGIFMYKKLLSLSADNDGSCKCRNYEECGA